MNILQQKHAVVFGAGGSIGSAVAKEFPPKVRKFSLLGEPNRTLKRLPSKLQRQAVARARQ